MSSFNSNQFSRFIQSNPFNEPDSFDPDFNSRFSNRHGPSKNLDFNSERHSFNQFASNSSRPNKLFKPTRNSKSPAKSLNHPRDFDFDYQDDNQFTQRFNSRQHEYYESEDELNEQEAYLAYQKIKARAAQRNSSSFSNPASSKPRSFDNDRRNPETNRGFNGPSNLQNFNQASNLSQSSKIFSNKRSSHGLRKEIDDFDFDPRSNFDTPDSFFRPSSSQRSRNDFRDFDNQSNEAFRARSSSRNSSSNAPQMNSDRNQRMPSQRNNYLGNRSNPPHNSNPFSSSFKRSKSIGPENRSSAQNGSSKPNGSNFAVKSSHRRSVSSSNDLANFSSKSNRRFSADSNFNHLSSNGNGKRNSKKDLSGYYSSNERSSRSRSSYNNNSASKNKKDSFYNSNSLGKFDDDIFNSHSKSNVTKTVEKLNPEDYNDSNSWRYATAIIKFWINSDISESGRKELMGIFKSPDFYLNPNIKFAIAHNVRGYYKCIAINSESLELIRQYIKQETGDTLSRPRLDFFNKIEPISFTSSDHLLKVKRDISEFNKSQDFIMLSDAKTKFTNTNWKKIQTYYKKKTHNFISIDYTSNKNFSISEIGWTIFNAANSRYLGRHFIVARDNVPIQTKSSNKGFMFGPSNVAQINKILSCLYDDITESGATVVTGFDFERIFKILNSLGLNLKTAFEGMSLSIVDTLMIYRSHKRDLKYTAVLKDVLNDFDIDYAQKQNSGNDSAFNMMLLIKLLDLKVPSPIEIFDSEKLCSDPRNYENIILTTEYSGLDTTEHNPYYGKLCYDFDTSSSSRSQQRPKSTPPTQSNASKSTHVSNNPFNKSQPEKSYGFSGNDFMNKFSNSQGNKANQTANRSNYIQQGPNSNDLSAQPRNFRPSFDRMNSNGQSNQRFAM
ncbi:hypothetical protein AYI69_g1192 [Smittium culicis]|uniref:Gfd2/YDR514C-like C-terminal domain-containing protein n=1 Tax=Smittium culicis TaxID=133412 RepID=A0A1R1YQZ2_9FUNG|nr:hypothetical protein AYI69_g1192 [Smittium culicis]